MQADIMEVHVILSVERYYQRKQRTVMLTIRCVPLRGKLEHGAGSSMST